MFRLKNLFPALALSLFLFPHSAAAFEFGPITVPNPKDLIVDAIEETLDDLADVAEDAKEALCDPKTMLIETCLVATIANDVIGDIADPAPCGAAGQGTCMLILNQKRYDEIGGPCERGLIELPNVICLAVPSRKDTLKKFEEIVRLIRKLVEAYNDFERYDPEKLAELYLALAAKDPEWVQQILLDSQHFDEAFAIMEGLGFETATMSLSGGGFVLVGGGVEGGVAIDSGIERFPQAYVTRVTSYGLQLGVGMDFLVGAWLAPNCDIGGESYGRSAQVDVGPGVGTAIWFDDEGTFSGVTAGIGVVGLGAGLAKLNARTDVTNLMCADQTDGNDDKDDDPIVTIVPPPGALPEPTQIIVTAGDTLWALAEAELGDPFLYTEIFALNRAQLSNPDLIRPGQVLTLPPRVD